MFRDQIYLWVLCPVIQFREGGGGLGWGSVIRFICDFMFSDLAKFMNTLDYFVIFYVQ